MIKKIDIDKKLIRGTKKIVRFNNIDQVKKLSKYQLSALTLENWSSVNVHNKKVICAPFQDDYWK